MNKQGTLGIGIAGAGVAAEFHLQAIRANEAAGVRLVSVADSNRARFPEIGATFGVACVGLGEMLADRRVDVVSICTPSSMHAEHAIAAARAGKHVLVEKPLALSLGDADAVIAACTEAGVTLGVVLQRRTDPVFQAVHRAIAAGDLGELTAGMVSMPYYRSPAYYAQSPWRGHWNGDGGGVLLSQGIHLVDVLVWYMGDPVDVHAFAAALKREIQVEDTLTATLRFANGAMATISATTTAAPGFPHRVEVYGTNGGIQIEGESVTRWDVADTSRRLWSGHPSRRLYRWARQATRAASQCRATLRSCAILWRQCGTVGDPSLMAPKPNVAWRPCWPSMMLQG